MRPTTHHLAVILAVLVLGCAATDDEPVIDDAPPADGSETTANRGAEGERDPAEEDEEIADDAPEERADGDPGDASDGDPPTDRSEVTGDTTGGTRSKTERPERSDAVRPPEQEPTEDDDPDPSEPDSDDTDTRLDDPPRVTIHLDGAASSMARGGSCWTDTAGDEVCGDPFGVVTGTDVHSVSAGAQVQLTLEPDIAPTQVAVVLLTPTADAEERGSRLVWPGTQLAHELGTSSLGPHRVEADPGHYLLQARLRFEQGSADFGVQLEVR